MTTASISERPILLSDVEVRAVLAGHKTELRLPVRPQPREGTFTMGGQQVPLAMVGFAQKRCRYRDAHLWVMETWCSGDPWITSGGYSNDPPRCVRFRADGRAYDYGTLISTEGWSRVEHWRSPSHLPRSCARLLLEVTGSRPERIQSITEDGARAEGLDWAAPQFLDEEPDEDPRAVGYSPAGSSFARDNFRRLWQLRHGQRFSWEKNPWVRVLTFRRIALVQGATSC